MNHPACMLVIFAVWFSQPTHATDVFLTCPATFLGPTINSNAGTEMKDQMGAAISSDGLSLYFTTGLNYPLRWDMATREFYADDQHSDIYRSTRDTIRSPWADPQPLDLINTEWEENGPSISADGTELYFADGWSAIRPINMNRREGETRRADLFVSKWDSAGQFWDEPVRLGPTVNSEFEDGSPSISADGRHLYFSSWRPNGSGKGDIWVSERDADGSWGKPENLGSPVNSEFTEIDPEISADGLMLFFISDAEGNGNLDLFVSTREQPADAWGPAVNLSFLVDHPEFDPNGFENAPAISSDESTLYLSVTRNREDNFDILQVPLFRTAAAAGDFDGDGSLDTSDMDLLMNEVAGGMHPVAYDLNRNGKVDDGDRDVWLAATPCSFGIQGPLLLGDSNFDGTVDSIDLNVLALNWLQDESHDWTEGNFTGAGVNAADLNALALNWQRSINETATVPEAGSLTLTTTLSVGPRSVLPPTFLVASSI